MSTPNPSDPRLLLPEWLRDDLSATPATVVVLPETAEAIETPIIDAEAPPVEPIPTRITAPYSERLPQDTRLDPDQLVSIADLPEWLGGLDQVDLPQLDSNEKTESGSALLFATIDTPEPYEGVDAPQSGTVDVPIDGRILVVAAVGLLILLAAALRLYFS